MSFFLSYFSEIRPPHEVLQSDALKWLEKAHLYAEATKRKISLSSKEFEKFEKSFQKIFHHVVCKPDVIHKRAGVIPDMLHDRWEEMKIYPLNRLPQGISLKNRMEIYQEVLEKLFDEFYTNEKTSPDHLIHVSCTGYVSPSAAQKMVSKKKWGDKTTVTHAYHMGCNGALPSIRMARGFISNEGEQADIVHTEVISIHGDFTNHEPDKLVGQSLFADGFIKYSVVKQKGEDPALKILTLHEEVIPDSSEAMKWLLTDSGFQLTLSKEIPALIAKTLKKHLQTLCLKGKSSEKEIVDTALFAIHPGGSKILQQAQAIFACQESQIRHSKEVLWKYGNMSSATLPHIWNAISTDDSVPIGTKIASFVFGPGLYVGSVLLEKV